MEHKYFTQYVSHLLPAVVAEAIAMSRAFEKLLSIACFTGLPLMIAIHAASLL